MAIDCVSVGETTAQIVKSLGTNAEGKKHVIKLLAPKDEDKAGQTDVKIEMCIVYSLKGVEIKVFGGFPVIPGDKEGKEKWMLQMPELVGSGKLKANPLWRRDGGLARVNEGLEDMKNGKYSAQKITYKI